MGTYNSTYIGIYLEVPHGTQPVVQQSYVDAQGKKTKNKFDPTSGQANAVKKETITQEVIPQSWITDDPALGEDTFFTPAYTNGGKNSTFVLNGRSKYSKTSDDLFNYDLSQLNLQQLIEDFKVEYAPYVAYYQKKYGDLAIKYGVVNYAH